MAQSALTIKQDVSDAIHKYWGRQLNLIRGKQGIGPSGMTIVQPGKTASALTIAKHGLKLAYAPSFFMFDLVARGHWRALNLSSRSNLQRLLLVPFDTIQRNGPHLAGYVVLHYSGFNASIATMENYTYMDDFSEIRPETIPLKEGEVVLIHFRYQDGNLAAKAINPIRQKYEKEGKKVIFINSDTPEELFRDIGEVRKKHGSIKDFHWLVHGQSGEMRLGDQELFDEKYLKRISKAAQEWPEDTFAPNSRMSLYSCNIAKNKKGESFVNQIGKIVLQNDGTIYAPAQYLRVDGRRALIKDAKESMSFSSHFIGLPLIGLFYTLTPAKLGDIITGDNNDPTLKEFRFKPGKEQEIIVHEFDELKK